LTTRHLLITLALTACATAACDATHTPTTPISAPTAAASTETDADAGIAAALAAGGFVAPAPFTVNEVWTKERPTYNQVYESCLIAFAITGAAGGRPIADAYCNGVAIQGSQHERPNWNDQVRSYFACLFMFTIRRAPGGVDIGRVCGRPATIPD
jgi:hypothetical protein